MAVNNDDLRRAEEIGRRGGFVDTSKMNPSDRNAIDAAVRKGNGSF